MRTESGKAGHHRARPREASGALEALLLGMVHGILMTPIAAEASARPRACHGGRGKAVGRVRAVVGVW